MKLPTSIEREIQAIEAELGSGQQAGPPRLRGLRSAIEAELQDKTKAARVWSAMQIDERIAFFHSWRNIEQPCDRCAGVGRYTYGSTATWHGGVGGQAMTTDVCDRCWGSGDLNNKAMDLRRLYSELETLRREAKNAKK